jgi:hydrogenase maturation protease
MSKVKVIGLGNVLVGDDAFGPHAVQTLLAEYEVGRDVEVLELGTPGFDLIPYLMGADALIVVDTVKADAPPGTLRLYDRAKIIDKPPPPRLSPHEPGLMETLLTLEMIGGAPRDVLVVGVVPRSTETGIALSPELVAAMPEAVAAVVAELTRLGHPPVRRLESGVPELWWTHEESFRAFETPLMAGETG